MTEYRITLAQGDVQTLFQALGELPLKISLGVFSKLQVQVQEQDVAGARPIEDVMESGDG